MNIPCSTLARRRPWSKRSPTEVGLTILILSSICCGGVAGRPEYERLGWGDRLPIGAASDLRKSHNLRGQHQQHSDFFAIPSGGSSEKYDESADFGPNVIGRSVENRFHSFVEDSTMKIAIITRQLDYAALSSQHSSDLSSRIRIPSRELSWGGDAKKPEDDQEDDVVDYENEEGTAPPDAGNEDNFEDEERKAEDDFYGSEIETSLESEIITETLPIEKEQANKSDTDSGTSPEYGGTSEPAFELGVNTTTISSENEESQTSKPENLSGTSSEEEEEEEEQEEEEEEENSISENTELAPPVEEATKPTIPIGEEAGASRPVGEIIPLTVATDAPIESKVPELPVSSSEPETFPEEGASESVSLSEQQPYEESLQELEEEEEEEKEKEEILQEELTREEREVRRIGGFGVFLAIVAMIFTAHQMSENPDGIYASCCRLIITLVSCGFKMVFMPFRSAVGGNRGYGHLPVSSDYGYRDPYRPGASNGGAMELS